MGDRHTWSVGDEDTSTKVTTMTMNVLLMEMMVIMMVIIMFRVNAIPWHGSKGGDAASTRWL